MHAAKPAAAIEQATIGSLSNRTRHAKSVQFTSDLSLTSAFRSRYGAAALKQHPDRLNANHILRCKTRSEGQLTAAVNRNVVIDF